LSRSAKAVLVLNSGHALFSRFAAEVIRAEQPELAGKIFMQTAVLKSGTPLIWRWSFDPRENS